MLRGRLWVLGCIASFSLWVHSTEIDSFTDRDPLLRDASSEVSILMDNYLQDALEIANQKHSCDSRVIEQAVLSKMGGQAWAAIEIDIENDPFIDKRRSEVKDSVYRDFSILDSLGLQIVKLGYLMRFGDLYIGSDKFGHFSETSHRYFDLVYRQGKQRVEALEYGEYTERTYLGLLLDGVYSYADLSANYSGLYFWQRVTNIDLDPGDEPYFTCENNLWKKAAVFNWSDYIQESWDEGINCNRYKNASMEPKVFQRIHELERYRMERLTCPIDPSSCQRMLDHYGPIAKYVITDKCF